MPGRYKTYPEYKESGVEWLEKHPESWEVSRIKFLATINPPKDRLRNLPGNTDVTFLPMEAISEKGEVDISREKKLIDVISGYTYVADGDVCIAKITPCFENGKGAVFKALKNGLGFATTEVVPLRCFKSEDAKFLYYLLTSKPFNKIAEGSMYGAGGQKRVSDNFVANYHFSLPSFAERQNIANFLDHETGKIDALIEKQQQLIKLLQEKRQAVISHAVTKGLNPAAPMKDSGIEWLGQVPIDWVVAKVAFRYEILLGKMLDSKKIDGKHLGFYLRNTDVQWDLINSEDLPEMDFHPDEQERYSVRKGDLLVCEGGEIGRCAIWEKEETCFYQKALHRLRPLDEGKDFPRYMFYLMFDAVARERFISEAGKATIAHLPAESFRQYRFAFPSLMEQKAIVNYLDAQKKKFDLLESKAKNQIELLQERRTALISAAVTGKIDVRDWVSPTETKKDI